MQLRLISDALNTEPLDTPVVVGRADDADLTLQDIWASRHHCEFDEVDGEVILRDLNSTHGTLVNDEPITERVLMPGDEVVIGLTRFAVMWKGSNIRTQQTENNASAARGNVV